MARKPKQEFETDLGPDSKTALPAPKRRKTTTAAKPKTARAIKPKQPQSAARTYHPSDDEIRLRAYFIAERRMRLALEGDSTHDWIEARQQLIDEAKQQKKL